jgi:hypothetical protein
MFFFLIRHNEACLNQQIKQMLEPEKPAELEHGCEYGEGYTVVVDLADPLRLRNRYELVPARLGYRLREVVHLEVLK